MSVYDIIHKNRNKNIFTTEQAELSYDKDTIASVRSWDFSRTRFTLKKADNPSENRYPGTDLVQPCYVDFMNGWSQPHAIVGSKEMLDGLFLFCTHK